MKRFKISNIPRHSHNFFYLFQLLLLAHIIICPNQRFHLFVCPYFQSTHVLQITWVCKRKSTIIFNCNHFLICSTYLLFLSVIVSILLEKTIAVWILVQEWAQALSKVVIFCSDNFHSSLPGHAFPEEETSPFLSVI